MSHFTAILTDSGSTSGGQSLALTWHDIRNSLRESAMGQIRWDILSMTREGS
jgi:hypothetical protein